MSKPIKVIALKEINNFYIEWTTDSYFRNSLYKAYFVRSFDNNSVPMDYDKFCGFVTEIFIAPSRRFFEVSKGDRFFFLQSDNMHFAVYVTGDEATVVLSVT